MTSRTNVGQGRAVGIWVEYNFCDKQDKISDFIKQNIYIFTTFYKLNVSLRIVSHNSHMHVVLPDPRKNDTFNYIKGAADKLILHVDLEWAGGGDETSIW